MEKRLSVHKKELKEVCNEFLAKSQQHIANIMEAYPGIERENAENLVVGWYLKDVVADDRVSDVYLVREESLQKHLDLWNSLNASKEAA